MTTEKSAADSSQSSEQNTTDNKVLQKARNKNRGKGKFELGTLGLVAGSFDFLGLEGLINENVGKKGSHVRANTGVEVKALIMQMLYVEWQGLMNTASFMTDVPCGELLGKDIKPDALNRSALARMLDDIYSFGTEKLFVLCAREVFSRIGLEPEEVHIDSTSFHYHGEGMKDDACEIQLKKGYSRDHHPELKQAISLMLVDGKSRIPLFGKNVSGNTSDNKSFLNMVRSSLPALREQFTKLKYLVGDSALCTEDILKEAAKKNILVVTRLPDKTDLAKKCFALLDEKKLQRIYERKPDGEEDENFGMWCDVDDDYKGTKLRLLLVKNYALRSLKKETVDKRAARELSTLNGRLKKLRTQPCKCRADAEKAVEALKNKLRLCRIDSADYEEVMKNEKPGRPRKGEETKKVVACCKVKAKASIDPQKVEDTITGELLYIVATTDTKREWTMAELLSTYKRQSVIERCWRCSKRPSMMVDSIYLQKPSRIDALLWLMELALLVYAATEYLARKVMKEKELKLTGAERRVNIRPTGEFLLRYVSYLGIALVLNRDTRRWAVENVNEEFALLLTALGDDWLKYYNDDHYEFMTEKVAA